MTILAIDQGTTSTRGLEIDDEGNARLVSTTRITQRYPAPGRVEHDPIQLLESIRHCLVACPEASQVGIDNQGESCLAWNRSTGEPLSPVIVWQDNRTEALIEKLQQDGYEQRTLARAGLPLDSYFSGSKLRWILDNVPSASSLLKNGQLGLGTTDAYFIERLTGRYVTDITTASRTSLMNIETGRWDSALCELFGVPEDILPEIVTTVGDYGQINNHQAMLTASVVDQQASLYGHGCRETGDAKITFGTGAFALMVTGDRLQRAPDQGLLPTIGWQRPGSGPVYALDGGVYCAGSALNWARSLGLFSDWSVINRFDAEPAIARGLAFVPALSGLACPHWDRRAAGLWIGMSLDTSATDLVQAVLEGVALRASEVVAAMEQYSEPRHSISIDGGVSINPYFCQFLAEVLNKQVIVQDFAELTALGTAQLAGAPAATDDDTRVRVYEPATEAGDFRSRFAEAVERARNWRN